MGRWRKVLREMFPRGPFLPPFPLRKLWKATAEKFTFCEGVNQSHISVSSNKWKQDEPDGLKQVKSDHRMTLGLVGKSMSMGSVSLEGRHSR